MEVADIIVVNKADRGGADRLVTELQGVLTLNPAKTREIVTTQAINKIGIVELYEQLKKCRESSKS